VLRNRAQLRNQALLDQYEAVAVEVSLSEPLPEGHLDVAHYRAIHRHMFRDVYRWAGDYRTVRIHKGQSTFCYPEHIADQMNRHFGQLANDRCLAGLSRLDFARGAAAFMATLNAIHPFREGNGRTMNVFIALLSIQADHPIDVRKIQRRSYLAAMIQSFDGNETPLAALIEDWII